MSSTLAFSPLIGPATVADIPAIAALEARYYHGDCYNPGFLYQAVVQWPDGLWVAKSASKVLGYALMAPGKTADEAWLMAAIVAEQGRGKGLGKQLCQACIQSAREAKRERLYLTVAQDNAVAIQLYRQLGFVQNALRHDFFGPGEHRIEMVLELSTSPS